MSIFSRPKTLLVVLLLSVGFNFIGVGLLLRPLLLNKTSGSPLALEKSSKSLNHLPPETRRVLLSHLHTRQQELQAAFNEMSANRNAILTIVREPQFNVSQLKEKMNRHRELMAQLLGFMQDGLIATLQDTPPEMREKLIKSVLKNSGRLARTAAFKQGLVDDAVVPSPSAVEENTLPLRQE